MKRLLQLAVCVVAVAIALVAVRGPGLGMTGIEAAFDSESSSGESVGGSPSPSVPRNEETAGRSNASLPAVKFGIEEDAIQSMAGNDEGARGEALSRLYSAASDQVWSILTRPALQQSERAKAVLSELVNACSIEVIRSSMDLSRPEAASWANAPSTPWCKQLAMKITGDELERVGRSLSEDEALAAWQAKHPTSLDTSLPADRLDQAVAERFETIRSSDAEVAARSAVALWDFGDERLVGSRSAFEPLTRSQRSRIGSVLHAWTECTIAGACGANTFATAQFCSAVPGTACLPHQSIDDIARRFLSPLELEHLQAAQQRIIALRRAL